MRNSLRDCTNPLAVASIDLTGDDLRQILHEGLRKRGCKIPETTEGHTLFLKHINEGSTLRVIYIKM